MGNYFRAELIKEKRSGNKKLVILIPIIFVIFNLLVNLLMGKSPDGRSYLMATAFNWYPLLILPIVLSLIEINTFHKEKQQQIDLQKRLGLSRVKIQLAKNGIMLIDLFSILIISAVLIGLMGNLLGQTIDFKQLVFGTLVLFIGCFPIIGIIQLVDKIWSKAFFVIMVNFLLTFLHLLWLYQKIGYFTRGHTVLRIVMIVCPILYAIFFSFYVGTSAGGTGATRFALDHPDRCKGLILYCSASPWDSKPKKIPKRMGPSEFLNNNIAMWLMSPLFEKTMGMDPILIYQMLPIDKRAEGVNIDIKITNRDLAVNFDDYQIEDLKVPTLVQHAKDDKVAPYSETKGHVKEALHRYPDLTKHIFETGGHLMKGHEKEIQNAVKSFIEKNE